MDELETRIEALERAVTDGDHDLSELAAEGETRERLAAVETELGDIADRVAELEAATQALRGYVGNVRAVNRDIEQRADTALAKAESVESALVGAEQPTDPGGGRSGHTVTDGHGHDRSGESATRHESEQGNSDPSTDAVRWSGDVTDGSSSDPGTEDTGGGARDRSTETTSERTSPDDAGHGSPGRPERDTGHGSAGRNHEQGQTGQDTGPGQTGQDTGPGQTGQDTGPGQTGQDVGGNRTVRGGADQPDRHGSDGEQAGRCDACGQPTSGHHGTDETRQATPEHPGTGESAFGQSTAEHPPGRSEGVSTGERSARNGSIPGQSTARGESGDGSKDDPFGGVFEPGERDEGDADGTFDRIRQML